MSLPPREYLQAAFTHNETRALKNHKGLGVFSGLGVYSDSKGMLIEGDSLYVTRWLCILVAFPGGKSSVVEYPHDRGLLIVRLCQNNYMRTTVWLRTASMFNDLSGC